MACSNTIVPRWFKAPRSLFHQLLLFFGVPLLILGGISIYTHYISAMNAATLAYDRTLLASARTVAERLVVAWVRLVAAPRTAPGTMQGCY